MLQLSDAAVDVIREMTEGAALRFSGHQEGDEIELEIEAAEEPVADDQVVERNGARVFLDPLAAEALSDQVLDVEPHGDHVHFSFAEQQDDPD